MKTLAPGQRAPVATVACIGVFDGVHRGHRRIIESTKRLAQNLGLKSLVLTLHPHPREVLTPGYRHDYLSDLDTRLKRFSELGIDFCRVIRFDKRTSSITRSAFVDRILKHHCRAQAVCVGTNFHFGAGATGNAKWLRSLSGKTFEEVHIVQAVKSDGSAVSSTRIRRLLNQAKVRQATAMLERPYAFEGKVVHGQGRGRSMGFPTVNLKLKTRSLLPPGVYAAQAFWGRSSAVAALHIGPRPTFGSKAVSVEAHLVGWKGIFKSPQLTIKVMQKLRNVHKFNSVEALQRQISKDIKRIKRIQIAL